MTSAPSSAPSQASSPKETSLTTRIFLALVAGILVGWLFPRFAISVSFLGDIFMAALMMLIVPLIIVSMVSGVASIGNPKDLGRLGGRTLLFFMITTFIAVFLGLVLVNWIKPGETPIPPHLEALLKKAPAVLVPSSPASAPSASLPSRPEKTRLSSFQEDLTNAFLKEILASFPSPTTDEKQRASLLAKQAAASVFSRFQGTLKDIPSPSLLVGVARAELIFSRVGMRRGVEHATDLRSRSQQKGPVLTVSVFLQQQIKKLLQNPFEAATQGNVLGLILFSLFFGLILVQMGSRARPILELVETLNEAMMRMVSLIMKLTPLGVFSLMAVQVASSGLEILLLLGKYIVCILLGLAIHGILILPAFLRVLGRRSPWVFFTQVRDALGVAFSTSSSSATLPVSMEVLEDKARLPKSVVSFVLPLGATVNMNGTALYEAVAAMFIAQIYGFDLSLTAQILIFATATLAAVGAAGIPSAGTVTMVMVLAAVGLPVAGIGLILAVDRVLDMFRTTINVWGDMVGAATLARYEPEAPPPPKAS